MNNKGLMKVFSLFIVVALLATAMPMRLAQAQTGTARSGAVIKAADRLVGLQNTADGGFPWMVGDTASATNVLGISAMGILKGYELDGKANYRTALANAYKYAKNNAPVYTWNGTRYTESIKGVDSSSDITFLVWLSEAAASDTDLLAAINTLQDPDITAAGIAALAKTRWDNKVLYLGSTKETPNGDATSLAQYIRDDRHAQNYDTLIPWDLELMVKAALALDAFFPEDGYDVQAFDIANVLYNSIDDSTDTYFDSDDLTQEEYVLGLTGGIEALSELNLHPEKVAELTAKLLEIQQPDGSWDIYHRPTAPTTPPTVGKESVQSTAYAIMALYKVGTPEALEAANRAAMWLASEQKTDGGWIAASDDQYEYPEYDSEAAWALSVLLINLDHTHIDENQNAGTVIGTLSALGEDLDESFTFALADGYPDNVNFTIDGNQLKSAAKFNYETKAFYRVGLEATGSWDQVLVRSVVISVDDLNDAPIVNPIGPKEVDEDASAPLTFVITAEDKDLPAQSLTFTLLSDDPYNYGASLSGSGLSGNFSWDPGEELGGAQYTFTVRVCDNGSPVACGEQSFKVTVKDTNETPVTGVDHYTVIKNTPRVVAAPGVLANDSDSDIPANTLTAVKQTNPSHGSLVFNSDGSFTYTPDEDYEEPVPPADPDDSFTYKVFDGTSYSTVQTVNIDIRLENKKPTDITIDYVDPGDYIVENNLPGALIGTLSTTDGDDTVFTYQLVPGEGSADNGSFTICGVSRNQLCAAEKFNFEVKNSYSVRVQTTDTFGESFARTLTINIGNDPEAPELDPISNKTVNEKSKLTFTATAHDEDKPAQLLTFKLINVIPPTSVTGAEMTLGGTFEWTPNEDQGFGRYTFAVQVCDETGECNFGTPTTPGVPPEKYKFMVTVNEVNFVPVASDQAVETKEGEAKVITLGATDADVNPTDTLTYVIVNTPKHGTLTAGGGLNKVKYTPDPTFTGTDSFTFQVFDGTVYSNIATVSITVTAENTAPKANDDIYNFLKDKTLNIAAPGVLLNDIDDDGDPLTVIDITVNVSHGTLVWHADGSFSYTPLSGSTSNDTFTYRISDGAKTDEATVSLNYKASNSAPTLLSLSPLDVDENGSYLGGLSATDAGGDALTYSLEAGALDNDAFEIVILEGHPYLASKSETEFNFEVKPSYQVRVRVTDQFGLFAESTFIIAVNNVNDAPVAEDQTITTLINKPVEFELLGSDEDGDELRYAIFSEPAHGTLEATEVLGINFAGEGVLRVIENKVTYTPDEGFAGVDSFTFKVMDSHGLVSNLATVTIHVGDLPVAVDDAYEATEDEELSVDAEEGVLANDTAVDPTKLVAELVGDVEHGTLELAPDGSFTYLPDENFVGEDVFTYKACIEGGECSEEPATVTITVEPVNDEPNAVDDEYETPMGKKLEVPAPGVLENDIDPDPSDEQTVEVKDLPLHGELVLNADGSFTYEPDAGFHGIDTFTYWLISEPGVQSAYMDSATVTITVRPVARIFLPIILK